MLHDHEDNLFLNQWGAANEPVYNMQGTVYLLRDDANAAIRTFYSTMACAFSHGQFEPVEHRWAWGQYFGPPSTDGAWFELYRNMLLSDLGAHNELFIARAVPRAWLADGNRIRVQHAPTCFGRVSFQITSAVQSNTIQASVEFLDQRRPAALLVRLRHPQAKPIKSVTVNGAPWNNVDPSRETVRIPNPSAKNYLIIARYDK